MQVGGRGVWAAYYTRLDTEGLEKCHFHFNIAHTVVVFTLGLKPPS